MPRRSISIQANDGVTLRGWFYIPEITTTPTSNKLPCLILSHGFSLVAEMGLTALAAHFTSHLPLTCLVYDHRGHGLSDVFPGQPRNECLPYVQVSDMQDAITFAQSLAEVDAEKIGLWGMSYSAGHALMLGATDRRVKAVIAQAPFVDGWAQFHRHTPPKAAMDITQAFTADRLARAKGEKPMVIPMISADPAGPAVLAGPENFAVLSKWESRGVGWVNETTLRGVEGFRGYSPGGLIHQIGPTPLLMVVAERDAVAPVDVALEAYGRAREPKALAWFPGGHVNGLEPEDGCFEIVAEKETEWLKGTLCKV